jgi:hypothetical protein
MYIRVHFYCDITIFIILYEQGQELFAGQHDPSYKRQFRLQSHDIGLGAFAASELDKVFSGYQPR